MQTTNFSTSKQIECVGKPDGFYVEGCQSNFFHCFNGATTELVCPNGFFYDILTNNCNYRELIEACDGKREKPKLIFYY